MKSNLKAYLLSLSSFIILFLILLLVANAAGIKSKSKSEEISYNVFKKRLYSYDYKSTDSIIDAKNLSLRFIRNADNQIEKEMAFADYRNFYYKALKNLKINKGGFSCSYDSDCGFWSGEEKTDKNLDKLIKENIYAPGFGLNASECSFHLTDNAEFMVKNFSKYLSPMWRNFLNFRLKEMNEGIAEDAGLLIKPDELRKRAIFWEKFLATYPEFPEKSEIKYDIDSYIYTYLRGMDNSSVFDWQTNSIKPEFSKSYEYFVRFNKNSRFYPCIKEYYDLIVKYNYKQNDKISDNFEKCNYNVDNSLVRNHSANSGRFALYKNRNKIY